LLLATGEKKKKAKQGIVRKKEKTFNSHFLPKQATSICKQNKNMTIYTTESAKMMNALR
jgi:hypothetical protein